MLATVYSRAPFGMEAPEVSIDVHLSGGLPSWSIVGLPETAVKESKDRVRAPVVNSGFAWPPGRITVNLAPAVLPKEGGRFDLPIALCLLAADGRLAPAPGEISLAHHGVLFLDELPEFDREALEALREPLEVGRIVVSRAARQAELPARFQLIAAMNPCPCGYFGDGTGRCRCGRARVARYHARLSGPLMDRVDLHVWVGPVDLAAEGPKLARGEASAVVARRVVAAREVQWRRQGVLNAGLDIAGLEHGCALSEEGREALRRDSRRLAWSGRAYHRVLRVARTIADLEDTERVSAAHVREAAAFRAVDPCLVAPAAAERGYVTAEEGVARVMESRFGEVPGSRSRQ